MKKIILGLIIILLLSGLTYAGVKMTRSELFKGICKTRAPLFLGIRPSVLDEICVRLNANKTLKCNFDTHTCEDFLAQKDSGNFKITLTVDGKPGKGIEVNLWFKPSPGGESLVKNTDEKGIAIFKGIPPGVYYPSTNLTNFPKEYGNAYKTWTWAVVTVIKGETAEIKIDLHSTP